ncbi:DUF7351 domain-containing protein [Natronomonas marina]|jgi:hypothetical protein|uniref:DUF7351 domain-containing protein n=1 Tax=Natronomonas marina TaxID=2961939 RepID=UPI0020C9B01D|nr:hypothetical protein [Natronomonas marina]
MGGDEGSPTSLDEAFGLVANDTRFDIIRTLWDADDEALSFSTLRDRTGVRDSGQFNYHLDQLVPRFVRNVPDGYELTYAGRQVIGAAVSGSYTEAETTVVDPIPAGTCVDPNCDGTIAARYENGYMTVECRVCATVITDELAAPPVLAAHHDVEDLPMVFSRYLLTWVQSVSRGFCRVCGGPVESSPARYHDDAPPLDEEDSDDEYVEVISECSACGWTAQSILAMVLLDHPAVISFLHGADIDLQETPLWELDWLTEARGVITGEDPIRVEVTLAIQDDRLHLVLDGDLTVIDHARE